MIRFLLKGLLRDRSRSFFPILIVSAGVALTVILYSYFNGVEIDAIRNYAVFATGHVKAMSRAYAAQAELIPNDLALLGVDSLMQDLETNYPQVRWTGRIRFGGLLDIPDENNETRIQGPVTGLAVDLFSVDTPEIDFLGLHRSLVQGKLPQRPGEVLIAEEYAGQLGLSAGSRVTLVSATMNGSLALENFLIAGTVRFGMAAMDRSAMIADIGDIRLALDMEDAAGEILGFFSDEIYKDEDAMAIAAEFNQAAPTDDEFAPVMYALSEQSDLRGMLQQTDSVIGMINGVFIAVMAMVLWNAGLMGTIRRYGEIGVRLAMGENKGSVYRSLILEALMIGFVGSLLGTAIGLGFAYLLQSKGIDAAGMMKSSNVMMSNVLRARITAGSFFVGFLPGLLAILLGTGLSGLSVYKRQTSQLFKELEV